MYSFPIDYLKESVELFVCLFIFSTRESEKYLTGDFALIKFCRLINVRFGDGPTKFNFFHKNSKSKVSFYHHSSFHWIHRVVFS